MNCPYCNSLKSVKNGYAPSRKKRWKCKECSRTFSINTGKGYPSTSIPFKFISLMLYHYEESGGKRFVGWVNTFLKMMGHKSVHRTTIYYWIQKYGDIYKKLITFEEANTWYWEHGIQLPRRKRQKKKVESESLSIDKIDKLSDGLWVGFLQWLEDEVGFKYYDINKFEKKYPVAFKRLKDCYKEILISENIRQISIESLI